MRKIKAQPGQAELPSPSSVLALAKAEPMKAAQVKEEKGEQKVQVITGAQVAKLHALGRDVLTAVIGVGEKYLTLCKFIRDNQIAAKKARYELGEVGFHRSVISKINRVAYAGDAEWKAFEGRLIGFNKVLDLTRAPARKLLAEATGTGEKEIIREAREAGAYDAEGTATAAAGTGEEKGKATKRRDALERDAARVLEAADFIGKKAGTWTFTTTKYRYVLKLSRVSIKAEVDAAFAAQAPAKQ